MSERLTVAVIVSFLNERDYLPALLESIERQSRAPDRLLLVDDGSEDGSFDIACAFAHRHPYVVALRRPPRPPQRDRLAQAAELKAFQWAVDRLEGGYDVVAKLDADLELHPSHLAEVCGALEREADLGIVGASLSVRTAGGALVREVQPPEHVRGPNKFYRRECLQQISPIPAHLGWDTIDETRARMHGWKTRSLALAAGETIHLRPVGAHDGRLRAFWRWGRCAYGFGAHPLSVLAGGAARVTKRPFVLGGLTYVLGWASAAVSSQPRADREARAFRRREDLHRLRGRLSIAR